MMIFVLEILEKSFKPVIEISNIGNIR
jgi:hypothetical protein